MAGSRFEYVKHFEIHNQLLLNTYIVVRIDGKGFTKFTTLHGYEKPNDLRGISLMNKAAEDVIKAFPEIWIAYGQSDEYSFVLRKNTELYNRRSEKIMTCIVSTFSSSFTMNFCQFFNNQKLLQIPIFDSRCICYPSDKNLRDYLSWRQADCHINNLYNTCFWELVQIDKISNEEAHKKLKGTFSGDKNELLFSKFGINYNEIDPIYRKGTILLNLEKHISKRKCKNKKNIKVEKEKNYPNEEIKEVITSKGNENELIKQIEAIKIEDENIKFATHPYSEKSGDKLTDQILILHEDLIQNSFWEKYKEIVLL